MITISGNVERIDRIKSIPPTDGVHMIGPDGFMKGCHSFMIGDKIVPRGMVGFYWRLKEGKGVKVFYSFKHDYCTGEKTIRKIRHNLQELAKYNICKEPYDLCTVKLDLYYKKKHIKKEAIGLVVRHVNYPEDIWMDYMKGIPYRWAGLDAVEHPLHNPKGFLEFVKIKAEVVKKLGLNIDERDRIGNTLYDTIDKRWWFVDAG